MSAIKLRQQFMDGCGQVLDDVMASARGERVDARIEPKQQKQIWDLLVPLITAADDPQPLAKLSDGTIEEKVDVILAEVAYGRITPARAKDLIGLLQAGYGDMTRETLDSAKAFIVNVNTGTKKSTKKK